MNSFGMEKRKVTYDFVRALHEVECLLSRSRGARHVLRLLKVVGKGTCHLAPQLFSFFEGRTALAAPVDAVLFEQAVSSFITDWVQIDDGISLNKGGCNSIIVKLLLQLSTYHHIVIRQLKQKDFIPQQSY